MSTINQILVNSTTYNIKTNSEYKTLTYGTDLTTTATILAKGTSKTVNTIVLDPGKYLVTIDLVCQTTTTTNNIQLILSAKQDSDEEYDSVNDMTEQWCNWNQSGSTGEKRFNVIKILNITSTITLYTNFWSNTGTSTRPYCNGCTVKALRLGM